MMIMINSGLLYPRFYCKCHVLWVCVMVMTMMLLSRNDNMITAQVTTTIRPQPRLSLSSLASSLNAYNYKLLCCDTLNFTADRCIADYSTDSSDDYSDNNNNNDSNYDENNGSGVSPKVLIISYVSRGAGQFAIPTIHQFAAYQHAIMNIYALHHHYHWIQLSDDDDPRFAGYEFDFETEDGRWHKIKIILDVLTGKYPAEDAKHVDYIVWIDADAIFLDFSMKIESIGHQFPNADIIASADIKMGYINSGVMIIRNSVWSRSFVEKWWTSVNRNITCDQDAFDLVYRQYVNQEALESESSSNDESISAKVKILAMDALNSRPPAMRYQQPYNQVLHLMGESTAMRAELFKIGLGNVCNAVSKNEPLAPQLTLTQETIRKVAEDVYSGELNENFRKCQERNISSVTYHDFDALSLAAHHLCDILLLNGGSEACDRVLAIRRNIFDTVKSRMQYLYELLMAKGKELQLKAAVSSVEEHGDNDVDAVAANSDDEKVSIIDASYVSYSDLAMEMIMLLKRGAEAGNDYFGASSSLLERKRIASEVFMILDELELRVAEESRNVPLHMKALMHQNLGRLFYEQGARELNDNALKKEDLPKHTRKLVQSQFTEAVIHLKKSVGIFEKVFGERSIDTAVNAEFLDSLQLTAAVLCLHAGLYSKDGDQSDIMKRNRLIDEALPAWDRSIDKAQRNLLGLRIGAQYARLAEVYHNAAVCHVQAGNRLGQAASLVDNAIDIREKIAAAMTLPGENSTTLPSDDNHELMVLSKLLRQSIVDTMKTETPKAKNTPVETAPLSPEPSTIGNRLLLVIPKGLSDNSEPILLNEDEWEECELDDPDCETFEVAANFSSSSETMGDNKVYSTKENILDSKSLAFDDLGVDCDGEIDDAELAEIREQYAEQSSRYSVQFAKESTASKPNSDQDDTETDEFYYREQTSPESVALFDEMNTLSGDEYSYEGESTQVVEDLTKRVEYLEQMVIQLLARVSLLEAKK